MPNSELRQQIEHLMSADAGAAARALGEFWASEPGQAAAGFLITRFEKLRPRLQLKPVRLAILRSFTVEPVVPLLRAAGFAAGMDLAIYIGDFNAYAQEILDASSGLYGFEPQAVLLAVHTDDMALARVIGQFRDLIRVFRERSHAHLVIHNFEIPAFPRRGVLDAQPDSTSIETGQVEAIQRVNRELRCLAREFPGIYILDYDGLTARHGKLAWRDERKWLTARMPIAAGQLIHLAQEWLRFLHPLTGKLAKALVVDLDNTLWGGIIGEDGLDGIRLGTEYPGAAFRALQQALLDLYERGILLAIASKNNPEEALEVLESHPGMLLRPGHFAAMRINWNDKASNLREIAAELNIGIDALAFLDDNPVERKRVRDELPEVTVIGLPADPMEYARAVRECPVFERLTLSEEDRNRPAYYAAERQRTELEQKVSTREDFYRSLRQEAEIAAVSSATLARVAQLTQKTNQFNLTTRRYTEQQITQMMASPEWRVMSIRVADCFADNGLVGVAITRDDGEVCEIDTFLLSCRVIGRTVETALLSALCEQARARGKRRLQGWFLPTKKNAPAREFYAQHGFEVVRQDERGSLWALELNGGGVACPEWIKVMVREKA